MIRRAPSMVTIRPRTIRSALCLLLIVVCSLRR
jgi:hypothetical protein